jgi:uncharacterized pyridoxamine 5'-phosphate oxidase family protein
VKVVKNKKYKISKVKRDKSLDSFEGEVLFKDKLNKANRVLKKYPVPQSIL